MKIRVFAALILAAYLLAQLAGLRSMGLTDDDDFYLPAGISYAEWLGKVVRFDGRAFSRPGIEAAFTPNHEHPPLAKMVFGISHFATRGLLGPHDSGRLGTVLFSTLSAAMLLSLALSHLGGARGLRVGAFSVLALLTLPRFYFHSHAATLDVPVAAMYAATCALALAAERSRRAALGVGPVFGLAASTKLNAPFFLLAYLPFVLLTRMGRATDPKIKEAAAAERGLSLPTLPAGLLSMAVLGPLTFLLSWPWLWFDTVARVKAYVAFHLNHYGIHLLYFGKIYTAKPFAPWHAPFVLAAGTIPLATSVLAIAGIAFALPAIRARLAYKDGPDDDYRREGDLLLMSLLAATTTISVVAFAGTPIYGGEKLFMPFFPFWCLFAGYGANELYERLRIELPRGWSRRVIPSSLAIMAAGSGLFLQLKFGGYVLSEYNGLIGGLRGATALGMERQYYDVAYRDLVGWLNDNAPRDLKIHFLPNNWEYVRTYRWYTRSKTLRSDIQVVSGEHQADWMVITHERRFARYADDLARYRQHPEIYEKRVDGVPLWSIVEVRR